MEVFNAVTAPGLYCVGYIEDGWTKEIEIRASRPQEAACKVQNRLGDICRVTYVERER